MDEEIEMGSRRLFPGLVGVVRWFVLAPLILVLFLLFIAIGGAVVQLLWNWLLPALFGWPQIGFWQALGLLALCRILFGGFAFRGSDRSSIRRRIRRRMEERWERMTPEERERLRQRMRERWGFGPHDGEHEAP
jgi:hypothetical protein